jgi:hypothetical protein
MKNPAPIYRYMFLAAVGFLFVGMLFTMIGIPADELFSVLGGVTTLVFYTIFSKADQSYRKANYPRHVVVYCLVIGQITKSFDLGIGTYLFLLALVAMIVWLVWSVLENLPPSED